MSTVLHPPSDRTTPVRAAAPAATPAAAPAAVPAAVPADAPLAAPALSTLERAARVRELALAQHPVRPAAPPADPPAADRGVRPCAPPTPATLATPATPVAPTPIATAPLAPAPAAAAPRPPGSPLLLVLKVQADLLAAPSHRAAAQRLVDGLARRQGHDEVALAYVRQGRLQGLLRSGGLPTDATLPAVRTLLTAMHEALDQRCLLLTPAPADEPLPRLRAAQHQLLGEAGGSVACVPLLHTAQGPGAGAAAALAAPGATPPPMAVLCALRRGVAKPPLTTTDAAALDHVAAFAAPILTLLSERERSLHWRLRQAWSRLPGAGQRHVRSALLAAAGALLLALLAWPVPHHLGGRARVEGAIQRTLVAPAAGYLKQVHVRPGDSVQAGQVLLELADEDLLLERERWAGQLAQVDSALAEANAKADRAQVMIQIARRSQAQAQLDGVQWQLDRTRLLAPFDAVVVHGDLSQRLGAPLEAGAELLTLAPSGQYRVVVDIDEAQITRVQPGQTGSLALSALPWDTLQLRVQRITPMAQAVEGRNVFEVEAELLDPPAGLRPGLAGSARLQVGQRPWLGGWLTDAAETARRLWWGWWG